MTFRRRIFAPLERGLVELSYGLEAFATGPLMAAARLADRLAGPAPDDGYGIWQLNGEPVAVQRAGGTITYDQLPPLDGEQLDRLNAQLATDAGADQLVAQLCATSADAGQPAPTLDHSLEEGPPDG